MNLAVLKYQFVSNPKGPDEWPAEVRELGDGTDLPDSNWVLMTEVEYSNHKAAHQTEYDSWQTAHPRVSGEIFYTPIVVGETITCSYTGKAVVGRSLSQGGCKPA